MSSKKEHDRFFKHFGIKVFKEGDFWVCERALANDGIARAYTPLAECATPEELEYKFYDDYMKSVSHGVNFEIKWTYFKNKEMAKKMKCVFFDRNKQTGEVA